MGKSGIYIAGGVVTIIVWAIAGQWLHRDIRCVGHVSHGICHGHYEKKTSEESVAR